MTIVLSNQSYQEIPTRQYSAIGADFCGRLLNNQWALTLSKNSTNARLARVSESSGFYPYVEYPYIEWFSDNGRVVLELDPSKVEIVGGAPVEEKTARGLVADKRRRTAAMGTFLRNVVKEFSRKNREQGGDGNDFGMLVE